jgi:hypothetical protein
VAELGFLPNPLAFFQFDAVLAPRPSLKTHSLIGRHVLHQLSVWNSTVGGSG